jgi:hypothetical protein
MKNAGRFLLLFIFIACLSSCEGLEKTDLIKRQTITQVQNKELVYEMYLTGLDKYRYTYKLVGPQDSTQLFEAKFTDETANNLEMEIEQSSNRFRIILDRPTETQTKTVDGVTFELAGTKN